MFSASKSGPVPLLLFSLIPEMPRNSMLASLRALLILCFSLAERLQVLAHSCFLVCPPLTVSCTSCLRCRACQQVPVWHAGFFSFRPVFLLIRTICVCIGRTLFKSNSETAWLLPPRFQSFPLYLLVSVRIGSRAGASLMLILSSGK